jgi:DNA-binding transcriptional LysR family regulator
MKRPDIAEFDAFLAVAEHRSFARAATERGIARSTLSETVRQLEERLGVRLLNRTTRSVALTPAGEQLVQRLRPVLDDFSAALESINAFRDRPSGSLRLTVAGPAADFVIAPLLGRFLAAYPEIRLEISRDSRLVDIVAERFDAGIRIGERLERDMIALRISEELRGVIAASPAYLARHPAPQRPGDLANHDCIRLRFASGAINPWRLLQDGRAIEVAVEGALICNDEGLAIRAACDGVGVVWTIRDYIAADLAAGRLVELLPQHAPSLSSWFLYYPSRRQVPAPLQALTEFLKRSLQEGRK